MISPGSIPPWIMCPGSIKTQHLIWCVYLMQENFSPLDMGTKIFQTQYLKFSSLDAWSFHLAQDGLVISKVTKCLGQLNTWMSLIFTFKAEMRYTQSKGHWERKGGLKMVMVGQYSICWFPWYENSHNGQFQATTTVKPTSLPISWKFSS